LSKDSFVDIVTRCFCLQCFDTVGWAGVRKSIRPVKISVMRCWCGYLSRARCRLFAYGPADATAIRWDLHHLLPHLNPDIYVCWHDARVVLSAASSQSSSQCTGGGSAELSSPVSQTSPMTLSSPSASSGVLSPTPGGTAALHTAFSKAASVVSKIHSRRFREYDTIRYDTRCYFNVRSKANMSQLNLPHGTDN